MWGGKKTPTEAAFGRLFRGRTRSTIVSGGPESWCFMFSTAPAIRPRHGKELVVALAKEGMAPVAIGLLFAIAGPAVFGRLLGSLLYEIGGRDPLTIAAVASLLGAVALAACLVPARRASRVDPLAALRCD